MCQMGFPEPPPITDADPSIRHAVNVRVPTSFRVGQRDDSLIYGFTALQTTNIMVGYKMATGVECQASMDCDGVEQPLFRQLGPLDFDTSTNRYTLGNARSTLEGGTNCIFVYHVTAFETEIPGQHMWSPKSGKFYRVLWTQTFRKAVK